MTFDSANEIMVHEIEQVVNLTRDDRNASSSSCRARYSETNTGTYILRAILVNLEPTVMDEIEWGRIDNCILQSNS
jgi:hypothetical protein